ncbi:DUF2169 family type VI secretion system accessory protein [Nannocystis radixulma]|uniref:DUF2169 domain-containing protein n=1 Tax=Nannocystis radixulma TaxID=2995305 RepID=A0ABT5BD30_9BACT|nr:DUF2169 domain-containing protein [Nannocystis radixulma]MDC0671628.1 DUF2169 domain-containing protein [Nannocystis radixulma]
MHPHTESVLLAADSEQRQIVSVHVKRTYDLLPTGECVRAEVQQPFLNMVGDELEDGAPPELDIIPYKAATDLIVMATAHAPRGRKVTQVVASLEFGAIRREYLVHGDRRCIYRGPGSVTFSRPEPFETILMRHEFAFGGCDPTVPVERPKTLLEAMSPHPGIYPRNPAGRGYVVSDDASLIDGLLLPNIEHPRDMITPERLISRRVENWWRQPLPWSCDWFDPNWYPRCAFLGVCPDFLPDDIGLLPEVKHGYLPVDVHQRQRDATIEKLFHPRWADAAAPGLIVPFMNGNEAIRFRNMTSDGEVVVRLPGERPQISVGFEGKQVELEPVVHRVLISLEEMGVYVVWHGAWPTPRELPSQPLGYDAATGADLGGVTVHVDGKPVAPMP